MSVYISDTAVGTTPVLVPGPSNKTRVISASRDIWVGDSGVAVGTGLQIGAGREHTLNPGLWYVVCNTNTELDVRVPDADTTPVTVSKGVSTFASKKYEARSNTDAPAVVTIMSGQVDEDSSIIAVSCTASADTVNFKVGARGHKITTAGAATAQFILDPPGGPSDPLTFVNGSTVWAWVYVPDPTKITSVTLGFYPTADLSGSNLWARSTLAADLVVGWNLLFHRGADATVVNWGNIYRARIVLVTNAATDITVGHMWIECKPKAQILFIDDRGYRTFADNGLPDLRALGVPVTWALDPALNGTSTGTKAEVITDSDVAAYAEAGDSISFHGWDGSETSAMTADQIRVDTLKAIRWLQQRGYGGRIWRAAWVQNAATNHSAAQPYVSAYATATSTAALESWPPASRWNISRYGLHGRTTGDLDTMFTRLQQTKQLFVCYTHGIHVDGGNDITPTMWNYFIDKVSEGITEGWLEGVTFEDLLARSGGRFPSGFGATVASFKDRVGTETTRTLL